MSWNGIRFAQCVKITTRWCGLFSTRQRQSIGIAVAWTDENRSEEEQGKSFRRVVAPLGQKVMWVATGKDASRTGPDSRCCQGICSGLFGAGQGANDYAVGAPDGVEAARAIMLEPDDSAWDAELLLSAMELPWDRKRRDPTMGQRAENTVAGFFRHQSLEQEEMDGKEEFAVRDGCTSERTSRSGSTVELRSVKVVLLSTQRMICQSLATANAGHELKV